MNRLKPPGRGVRRSVVEALVHVLPTGNHTVVAGWPDEEAIALECSARCPVTPTDRSTGWWIQEPNELSWLLDGVEGKERVQLLRKRSMAGVLAYATAHTVFFTHGLYGCPRPPKRKTLVNLWHGDGPKRTDTQHVSPQIRRATLSRNRLVGTVQGRFLRCSSNSPPRHWESADRPIRPAAHRRSGRGARNSGGKTAGVVAADLSKRSRASGPAVGRQRLPLGITRHSGTVVHGPCRGQPPGPHGRREAAPAGFRQFHRNRAQRRY
jgi:hypothetical protein